MDFYERIDTAFKRLSVNRAEVGRETGITGQAVTLKLQRKSAVTPREIEVYARYAQMSVSEALGEGAVVLEMKDEQDLIELYRQMTAEQRKLFFSLGQQITTPAPTPVAAND